MATPVPPPPPPPLDARGLPVGYAIKRDLEVTPREVRDMRAARRAFVLLDCRLASEHATARIEGSTLIPLAEVEQRLDELECDGPEARSTEIVVHCHHGVRSLRVTNALRAHGFTNVRSMAGGIDLWSIDIDSKVPRY
jgi:rhodanese-related sulfurtransferase